MDQTHFTVLVSRAAQLRRAARDTVPLYMPVLSHVLRRKDPLFSLVGVFASFAGKTPTNENSTALPKAKKRFLRKFCSISSRASPH